jgi:hypothetical protein
MRSVCDVRILLAGVAATCILLAGCAAAVKQPPYVEHGSKTESQSNCQPAEQGKPADEHCKKAQPK